MTGRISLDALGCLVADRASDLTGVHPDEIRREMGPRRLIVARDPADPDWIFDGHMVASQVGVAVEQAMREVAAIHPRAADD